MSPFAEASMTPKRGIGYGPSRPPPAACSSTDAAAASSLRGAPRASSGSSNSHRPRDATVTHMHGLFFLSFHGSRLQHRLSNHLSLSLV